MKKTDVEIFEAAVQVLGLELGFKTVGYNGTPWYSFSHGDSYTGWTFDLDGSFQSCVTRDYENHDVQPLEESMVKLLGFVIECRFSAWCEGENS